ncbi:nucleoside hydrolase [Maritalea mediterranea]|uniref:Nucleoside hydrolase n=1 Tax=Maritalea mediterranea TaxID=2909667 RepID=A0ABS9EB77_9HYPH|nr:nucleoside hydrolase [Maritalea mediterranea]MCF4098701.1 nucleoside hydrolase [Maritalea mediterranea]
MCAAVLDKRPVIIDCDPGQDDALMLFLALNAPELDVLGVVAVGGNVPLARTEINCRILVEMAGRGDVPVFAGCLGPMVEPLFTAEYVHGETGIDGIAFFEPSLPEQAQHGVDFIIETLRAAADDSVEMVITGPMTNLGMALKKAPDIAGKIKQIAIMGGASFEAGNVTPSAEFNIYVDPQAADIVMKCGRPIAMFGLDVTHKVMTSPEIVDRLNALGSDVAKSCAGMLEFFGQYDAAKYSAEGGPLHDPCTVAWMLKPELFQLKPCHIEIETRSELTRGHTAVDFWGVTGKQANAQWAYGVDRDMFFDFLIERIGRYN